ncbi:MAG: phosphotransferase [Desulfobulbaceae bacterium]|nr:phosphotransferase [Desulfobulbaceae bacterium]
MGIITNLFHRSHGLSKQKYNMFFLDMGENIHFHYRDLRIEFSVEEFVELTTMFDRCKVGVQKEIQAGYQDGVLPNTNESTTIKTFWTEDRKLVNPVKYNDNAISLEETEDGYHLHLRNYKLLLDKQSFTALAEAMGEALPLLKNKDLVRDPLLLLEQNNLKPHLISRLINENGENLHLAVERQFLGKACRIMQALGYSLINSNPQLKILVKESSSITLGELGDSRQNGKVMAPAQTSSVDLVSFIAQYASTLDNETLNEVKLKVLYLFKLAELKRVPAFTLEDVIVDVQTWTPRVNLFTQQPDTVAKIEYSRFNSLLHAKNLALAKPKKKVFPPIEQERLQAKFMNYLIEKIIPHPCVSRIYVMGSSTRLQAGRYIVPFVHIEWAKLKSDFDLYIEIDPDYEDDIPEEWDRKFRYDVNASVYYHLGDVGDGSQSEQAAQYPELCFYEHLIEAFLFFPSQGDARIKENYIKHFQGQLVYTKEGTREWIEETYGIPIINVARFQAASFNKVYHVTSTQQQYALKIYRTKYLSKSRKNCVYYEVDVLNGLRKSGLELPFPVQDLSDEYISPMGENQAVLFNCLDGKYIIDPKPEHAKTAGAYLARFHLASKNYSSKYQKSFDNREAPLTWLQIWSEYKQQKIIKDSPLKNISSYIEKVQKLDTFFSHCHGDLSPINYLFDKQGVCRLIDFQNIAYGPVILDLANGMAEFGAHCEKFSMENLVAYRRGYETVRPLSKKERELIYDLVIVQIAARQARLLRLHYGGYGYELYTDRLAGLNQGLAILLDDANRPSCTLPVLSPQQRKISSKDIFTPQSIGYRLTYRCNSQCQHCYCYDHEDHVKKEELDLATATRVIDEAYAYGIRGLGLSGGEPFLLPDHVFKLVEHAKALNFRVNLATNAFWAKRSKSARRYLNRLKSLGFKPPEDSFTISVGQFHLEYINKSCSMHLIKYHNEIFDCPLRQINFEYVKERPDILENYVSYLHNNGLDKNNYTLNKRTVFQSIGHSALTNANAVVKRPAESFTTTCNWLTDLIIEPTGDVFPCCGFNRYNKGIVIGNVYRSSIQQIIENAQHNPVMTLLRKHSFAQLHSFLIEAGFSLPFVADGLCNFCEIIFEDEKQVDFLINNFST